MQDFARSDWLDSNPRLGMLQQILKLVYSRGVKEELECTKSWILQIFNLLQKLVPWKFLQHSPWDFREISKSNNKKCQKIKPENQ